MDLTAVTSYRVARTRADLVLRPGERVIAGGTWVYSDPDPTVTGLVDLMGMDWPALQSDPSGLRVASTCTIADLAALPPRPGWAAQPLFSQCAHALLASFKVAGVATVGGNICQAFAAGSMTALAVALEGSARIWCPDGSDRTAPVASLIAGNGRNTLAPGEVLREVLLPIEALRSRTACRQISLARLGRSAALLIGRLDDAGRFSLVVTAATERPQVLRYPALPNPSELAAQVAAAPGFYTDPLGAADWRRAVSQVLAIEILDELS